MPQLHIQDPCLSVPSSANTRPHHSSPGVLLTLALTKSQTEISPTEVLTPPPGPAPRGLCA